MRNPLKAWYLLPILSGWLLSLACPPGQLPHLVWVGLVPLLVFLHRARSPWQALRGAWLAGVVYYLIILFPFLSLTWWGWAQTPEEYAASLQQQRMFLAIWYPLAYGWSSFWWGLWGAALVWLARSRRQRLWLAPALWILLCEALRSATFFDYTWGFLGYALHPYETLRQAASVIGVMGLSALVVLVNGWAAHLLLTGWACIEFLQVIKRLSKYFRCPRENLVRRMPPS
jgi:apolipoprotein N-acyltransferase